MLKNSALTFDLCQIAIALVGIKIMPRWNATHFGIILMPWYNSGQFKSYCSTKNPSALGIHSHHYEFQSSRENSPRIRPYCKEKLFNQDTDHIERKISAISLVNSSTLPLLTRTYVPQFDSLKFNKRQWYIEKISEIQLDIC